ncbi:MAG: putative Ig domain-containing protein, partial [Comamonas sp.]
NVSILDLSDRRAPTLSATVPVGDTPRGVAVHPDGSQVYVNNSASNNVSVIDTATKQVIPVEVGASPFSPGNFITYTKLTLAATDLPPAAVGQPFSQKLSATGWKAPYTWSLSDAPSWLQIDPRTGVLSGMPDAPAPASAPLSFTATVTDSSTPTARSDSKTLSLTVAPKLLNTTPTLPGGTVGVAYSATLTATGGTTPYQWTAASLPPGLSITGSDSSWVLSGTPAQEGSYTVTLELSDSGASNAQTALPQTFTVVIAPAPVVVPPLVITTTGVLPEAGEGQAYSQQLLVTGGTAPYSWSVVTGSLPPGLTLDATGLLSGTVPKAALLAGQAGQVTKAAGSFSFGVQVTDSSSPQPQSAKQQLSLEVTAAEVVPVAPTPVPSLGTWALVLLNLAAAVIGGLAWRWRRKPFQA